MPHPTLSRLPAALLAAAGLTLPGHALGGSTWFWLDPDQTVCDAKHTDTCDVEIGWSVSNVDRFNKWKICWKEQESSTWLDDHCAYHSRLVDIEDDSYVIPDLAIGGYYRIKLEGRRERNDKWTCVQKGLIRAVGNGVGLGNGGACVDF